MNFASKTSALCLGTVILATASFAASHSDKAAAAAVEARHAQMGLIAYHTGILGGMAKGEADYDADLARAAATNLHAAASMAPATMWLEGTEQGAIDGSRAKPEVWSDAAGFADRLNALQMASAAMIDAAATDLDSLKTAMGDVGKACGACHDDYRGPKN
tara:strand:+ start:117660 stop:118139 length:480 start_codon:yes stop_codon:yes gene_type:complete